MRCCEWILAIAWVGTMRHAADVALASAVKSSFDTGLCAAWITAVVAVGGRAAFVVSRFHVSGGGTYPRVPTRARCLTRFFSPRVRRAAR